LKNPLQNILKFLIFLGLGLGILYFVYQNQNEAYQAQCALDGVAKADCSLMQKVVNDFKSVHLGWLGAAFTAYLISNLSRALRWQMLLKSLGSSTRFINSFLTIMLGLFANLGFPRLGEVLRPVTLAKYEEIPVEKVLGTIVVDRTMDVLSLLIIVSIAFFLEFDTLWGYLSENMVSDKGGTGLLGNPIVLGILGSGLLGLVLIFIFREKIQATAIYGKVKQILLGFLDGILSIRNLEKPWLFIVYSVLIWAGYYLMFYFYMPAFGPTAHLGLTVALMTFVFGTFGIVIPSPGGMGTYHFLIIACLTLYGVNDGDAFSSANISFFATHFANILFGLAAVLLLPIVNKHYQPTPLVEVGKKRTPKKAEMA